MIVRVVERAQTRRSQNNDALDFPANPEVAAAAAASAEAEIDLHLLCFCYCDAPGIVLVRRNAASKLSIVYVLTEHLVSTASARIVVQ